MDKIRIIILTAFIFLAFFSKIIIVHAAVTSIGEINVEGNDQGKVLASSKATLIATLIIDRSLAEPGEEIKTIEFVMPAGFSADPSEVTEVLLNAKASDFTPEVSGASLRIELAELILDVNTVSKIVFKVSTPSVTMKNATFLVRLRNFHDEAIGDFVRPGPAEEGRREQLAAHQGPRCVRQPARHSRARPVGPIRSIDGGDPPPGVGPPAIGRLRHRSDRHQAAAG